MNLARAIYRYLVVVLVVDVVVQFFLAGAAIFRADGGVAHESSAFDPHRTNGTVIQFIALLVLLAAITARNGRWKPALAVFVLSIVQIFLAIGGWAVAFTHSVDCSFSASGLDGPRCLAGSILSPGVRAGLNG